MFAGLLVAGGCGEGWELVMGSEVTSCRRLGRGVTTSNDSKITSCQCPQQGATTSNKKGAISLRVNISEPSGACNRSFIRNDMHFSARCEDVSERLTKKTCTT